VKVIAVRWSVSKKKENANGRMVEPFVRGIVSLAAEPARLSLRAQTPVGSLIAWLLVAKHDADGDAAQVRSNQ